jgi:tRNA A-37 threonylcarbamoyl transferase component Bud32
MLLPNFNADVANEILATLSRLHQHEVLYHDAEPRNVLYDKRTGRCIIVNLMLVEFHDQQPLEPVNVNDRNWKRK